MNKILAKFASLILFVVLLNACKKEEAQTPLPTFDEFVKSQTSLSMFGKMVEKANLKDFTNAPGPFTWFAPTDAAFTAAAITVDSLNKMSSGTASYYLVYHLINANYTSVDMLASNSISRTTQLGSAVYNGTFNGNFYVNGGKINGLDIPVSNGTFHVSDKFLIPPVLRGNIQTMLNSTGQHTLFIAALTRAGLWSQLATTATFTVMAPTDAAMTAAGFTTASIAATPVATLVSQFRYHIFLNVRLFTNDLAANATTIATSAGPSTSLITSEGGTKVKGKNNVTSILISKSDALGTNGVVQIIDDVLKP